MFGKHWWTVLSNSGFGICGRLDKMKAQSSDGRLIWIGLALIIVAGSVSTCQATKPSTSQLQTTSFVANPPEVSLVGASATRDTLEFTVAISGFPSIANDQFLSDWLCDPHVTTDGIARVSGFGYEITKLNGVSAPIGWGKHGEPFEIHYQGEWVLAQANTRIIPVHIDLTIGPCYPDAVVGTTPIPNIYFVANYAFETEIPIE